MKKRFVLVLVLTILLSMFALPCFAIFYPTSIDPGGDYTIPEVEGVDANGTPYYMAVVSFDPETHWFYYATGASVYHDGSQIRIYPNTKKKATLYVYKPGISEDWEQIKQNSTSVDYMRISADYTFVYSNVDVNNYNGELVFDKGTHPLPSPPPPPYLLSPEIVAALEGILPGLGMTLSTVLGVSLVILAILLGISLIRRIPFSFL